MYRNFFRLIFLFQSHAFFVVYCNRIKYFKYSKYYASDSYATIIGFQFLVLFTVLFMSPAIHYLLLKRHVNSQYVAGDMIKTVFY